MQPALVYILAASIWSGYGIGSINGGGEFKTYDNCAHAAKMFFYEHTDKDAYSFGDFPEFRDTEMSGNIHFTWRCEGYVR